jgi:hypothetical protein
VRSEPEIRDELSRRRRLLANSRAAMQPHMGMVDNESAVIMLEWMLNGQIKPRWETEGENSLGRVWWKLGLVKLCPWFRIRSG